MKILLSIGGASGSIYGIKLFEEFLHTNNEVHLIVSDGAKKIIEYETDFNFEHLKEKTNFYYDNSDMFAGPASGSFKIDAMVICPCSMKTLSALANSYADNLITRSADTTIKERKRLVLLARETPLHLCHLRNMEKLTEIGAVVFPPIPGFYYKPQTIQDLIDHTVGKVLDIFDIEHNLFQRWPGIH